ISSAHATSTAPACERPRDSRDPTLKLRIVAAKIVGINHLKLAVTAGRGSVLDAIGFKMGSLESRGLSQAGAVDVACALEINAWNGTERVQLRLKDVRASAIG